MHQKRKSKSPENLQKEAYDRREGTKNVSVKSPCGGDLSQAELLPQDWMKHQTEDGKEGIRRGTISQTLGGDSREASLVFQIREVVKNFHVSLGLGSRGHNMINGGLEDSESPGDANTRKEDKNQAFIYLLAKGQQT